MLKIASEMFDKSLKYDRDGNIVERITNVISELTEDELHLVYETDYLMVFKKRN